MNRVQSSVVITGALALFTVHCPLSISYAESFLAQQAQLAWQHRDEPGQTEQAIQIWQQAIQAEPQRADLYIPLTRACGRAVRHAPNPEQHKHWADLGRKYGEQAVAGNPQSSEAWAAYGEALGQWAQAHKGIHSLKAVRQAVDALKKAIELDPKNAYAHMLLSSFYRESPGLISVGDKTKALEQGRLAVQWGPGFAINHLVLAKSLIEAGHKDEAAAELQKILALSPPADAVPETRADQDTARTMLQSMGIAPAAIVHGTSTQTSTACGSPDGVCKEQP